jgi:hypothetical protein
VALGRREVPGAIARIQREAMRSGIARLVADRIDTYTPGMAEQRRRFKGIRAVLKAVLVLGVVAAIGWVLTGPPLGPLPEWGRWSLPDDVSTMQRSRADRFALVGDADGPVVVDLRSGTSSRLDEARQDPEENNSFITDEGVSGVIHSGTLTTYDHHGRRLWRLPLKDLDSPELVAHSEDTVVIAERCEVGRQEVVGITIATGEVRWKQTVETCDFHATGLASGAMFSMPADTDGERWDIRTIDDGRTVHTVALEDAWDARDDRLLTVQDGRVVATAFPQRTQRWSSAVCPAASGYRSFGESGNGDDVDEAVIVTCGDGSRRVLDPRNGRNVALPKGNAEYGHIQTTPTTLVGVRQTDERIEATDLLSGRQLWSRTKPAGDLYISTTPSYAVIESNDASRNSFSVKNLTTGEERAHSPSWGDWWAGAAGGQGVWVTHRSLCTAAYDCKLHSTYLLT